jgi:hypothetical protein
LQGLSSGRKFVRRQVGKGKLALDLLVAEFVGAWLPRGGTKSSKVPVFVVGCQRSGTTMLLRVLNGSSAVAVFPETNRRAYSEEVRLRTDNQLRYLIHRSEAFLVVFKPLNETQRTDRLLATHSNSKSIWMYRDYADVTNSMVSLWGDAQIAHVEQIAAGRFSGPGAAALGERLRSKHQESIRAWSRTELSEFDAAAAVWYLRNSFFFDLALDERSDVLLVNYEDAVRNPNRVFPRVFDYLGLESSPDYYRGVSAASIGKNKPPKIHPAIASACEDLQTRLDSQYHEQVDVWPEDCRARRF